MTTIGTTSGARDVPGDLAVARDRAVLVVVDFQEKLAGVMPEQACAQAERNTCILIEAARRFGIPVVVTEQYPRGLGPTVEPIERALATLSDVHRFDKVEFSVCDAAAFPAVRESLGESRDQWILTGIEAHICVYQTARALRHTGHRVQVCIDAVTSRFKHNWRVGLDLIERTGAILTTAEIVVFDLLGRAGTDDFKALSKLVL